MSDQAVEPPSFSMPLHEAIFWRGVFLHRYSGMEQTVTELLLRAAVLKEYAELGPLPQPWRKRINLLRAMLSIPGPLSKYADKLRESLKPITGVEEQRHLFAHGMMSYNPTGSRPGEFYIQSYDWKKNGGLGQVYMWFNIEDIRRLADEIGPLVQNFTRTVAHVFREAGLVAIETGEPVPLTQAEREI